MLRKFTARDIDTYEVLRAENGTPVTRAEAKKLIKSFIESRNCDGLYEFILEHDKEAVGQVSFYEAGKNTYEIGIQILKAFRNMGYASQAIESIAKYSNGITFIANVDKRNIASVKVFNKTARGKYESEYSVQFIL